MKSLRLWGAIIVIVVGVAAVLYLRGDRRQIKRQLDALATTASVTGTETDIETLARAAHLGGFFTEDVVIRRSEDNSAFVGGRPAVAGMAAQVASQNRTMKVSIKNVDISLADGSTATADMTVVVSMSNAEAESVDLREVMASLRKVNGTWLISQAEVRPSR